MAQLVQRGIKPSTHPHKAATQLHTGSRTCQFSDSGADGCGSRAGLGEGCDLDSKGQSLQVLGCFFDFCGSGAEVRGRQGWACPRTPPKQQVEGTF